jgi:glyceraldehyde-3-phosphate dehydrogenase (NADP+)
MKELKFPKFEAIPQEYQINIPFKQTSYLINGEIRMWDGEFEKVYAPIYYKKDGEFDNYIGEYPLMKESDSLEALDAAVNAYDHGKGIWPAMTVFSENCSCTEIHNVDERKEGRGCEHAYVGNRKKSARFS